MYGYNSQLWVVYDIVCKKTYYCDLPTKDADLPTKDGYHVWLLLFYPHDIT